MEPWVVAEEITRVLKEGDFVYSEVPFLQAVHEGAYDFTRFTLGGASRPVSPVPRGRSGKRSRSWHQLRLGCNRTRGIPVPTTTSRAAPKCCSSRCGRVDQVRRPLDREEAASRGRRVVYLLLGNEDV